MRIPFNKILIIFISIIIGAIIIAQFLPKPKMSFNDKQELLLMIKRINSELPRDIGTVGKLDRVTYDSDVITFHFSVPGDSSIDALYEDNHDEFREILKYGVITLNGQNNGGENLAELLKCKGLPLYIEIKTPSNRIFQWTFTGEELLDFIRSVRISPTEALSRIIDAQLKLANLNLPLESNDPGSVNTIITKFIGSTVGEDCKLLKILHDDNNIVFVCQTNECDTTIPQIKEYLERPTTIYDFAENMSEDPDAREFMDMLADSHSNLIYRIKNVASTDSVDILIPCEVLKNYSSN